ncbi:MAG TPA: DNA-processing protein DprA, partial [Candidatus Dormibacteraeota bacterium]|nr:DNA-processing protein DprA [Candidatus Dormibacteraeota bacterium]
IHDETATMSRALSRADVRYPSRLAEVPDAPATLHVRGALVDADALAVAIVGSRRATPYGLEVAETLAADLAARGVTIVSGLARGIDAAAHRGALRVGGRTLAVLGSGIDVIYPPENRRLAAEIAERGALLSQFAPGTPPLPQNFPTRNHVIAALSLAVVVVEAAEKSGSLITARLAAELGREVLAVPGRITAPESRGANRLIQDGAHVAMGWEDVVGVLPERWKARVTATAGIGRAGDAAAVGRGALEGEPSGYRSILELLGEDPIDIDHVIERSGLGAGRVSAALLELELEGRVRQIEGKRFVRVGRG